MSGVWCLVLIVDDVIDGTDDVIADVGRTAAVNTGGLWVALWL